MLAAVKKGNAAEEGCYLERELAAAIDALKIANASADDQMFQKREALAQRDKAREDALEEAAKVCDEKADAWVVPGQSPFAQLAAAIRAMKECGK